MNLAESLGPQQSLHNGVGVAALSTGWCVCSDLCPGPAPSGHVALCVWERDSVEAVGVFFRMWGRILGKNWKVLFWKGCEKLGGQKSVESTHSEGNFHTLPAPPPPAGPGCWQGEQGWCPGQGGALERRSKIGTGAPGSWACAVTLRQRGLPNQTTGWGFPAALSWCRGSICQLLEGAGTAGGAQHRGGQEEEKLSSDMVHEFPRAVSHSTANQWLRKTPSLSVLEAWSLNQVSRTTPWKPGRGILPCLLSSTGLLVPWLCSAGRCLTPAFVVLRHSPVFLHVSVFLGHQSYYIILGTHSTPVWPDGN